MDRLLDPKNDWAFKQVFGQEKNKNILISFLNAMFKDVQAELYVYHSAQTFLLA